MKDQQPALTCFSPQLAGTLLWTAAAPEGNLSAQPQSADNKVSAAWDATLKTSLNPQSAFTSAAVAQQLVTMLMQQAGSVSGIPDSETGGLEAESALQSFKASLSTAEASSRSPSESRLPERANLPLHAPSNALAAEAEDLMTAARANRPSGIINLAVGC